MRLPITYPKALANVVLPGLLSLWIPATQAVQLNFSAVLSPSTCTFSLSEGTVSLGDLSVSSLQPATLVGARPFTLRVTNCSGIEETLTPVVNITGDGITQDGRWLFRSADSVASNVGVMLVNSSVMPDYSRPEVKNGDNLPLTAQAGRPTDQNIAFYAGATCGGASGCANVGMGTILARVTFSLDYR